MHFFGGHYEVLLQSYLKNIVKQKEENDVWLPNLDLFVLLVTLFF